MKKTRMVINTEPRKELVLEAMICDRCLVEFPVSDPLNGVQDFINIKGTGGYGSNWPGDLTTYELDLCEPCQKELFEPFARIREPMG